MQTAATFQPLRPWLTHPRESVGGAILATIGLVALAGSVDAMPLLPRFATQGQPPIAASPPPKLSPLQVRDLPAETALALNARIPLADGPNPAAPAFVLQGSAETRARALECLTSAIYYEAAREPTDGQRAVAQVVLNRVRHPAFPDSVCGVVYEGSTRITGCQFTFTCDGSMRFAPIPSLWQRARQVAEAALNGQVFAPAGYATHYHANYVMPYWAPSLVKTSVQGAHIFYRWSGGWGRPNAFTERWAGREGSPAALRLAALNAPRPATPLNDGDSAIAKLEEAGARLVEADNGRVRLLFTPQAREAVEKVKVVPYVDRSAASDNLKFALNGAPPGDGERPFGRAPEGVGNGTEQVMPGASSRRDAAATLTAR